MDEITFRYRLYPSEEQAGTIRRICGVSRVFYNELLQERTDAFLRTGVWKRKLDLMETGQDRAQLNGIDVSVLNYAALDLERAFRNFHRYTMKEPDRYHSVAKTRAAFYKKFPLTDADLIGYPQERKFGGPRETFSLSPAILSWTDRFVSIPSVGNVRVVIHRPLPENAEMRRAVVVRRSSGRFYLLIILRLPEKERAPNDMPERALGVVFMPGKLAVRSDGVQVPVRHTDDKLEEQIRKAYQTLRRRTPGSKRYDEQRRKLARLYEKQAARRRDALHKASREIIDSGASIGVQVPAVKKMARYHKKSGWDKTVRDEAWYTFFSMLRYKAKLAGWPLHVVPRELPVWRTCSKCGAALERAPRTSAWLCPTCGHLTGKGINAARNVAAVVQYDLDEWKRLPPSSLSL